MTDKKLYHYKQNNTGGFYTGPAYHIVVEAVDEKDAWEKAQALGATNKGSCECCGDRWSVFGEEMVESYERGKYTIFADSAIELGGYTGRHRKIPLIVGCPEWREGDFNIVCDYENFKKISLTQESNLVE